MDYSKQDQQSSDTYRYPPNLPLSHPQPLFTTSPASRPSPPPTPLSAVPYMSAPGSYPSSAGSGSMSHAHRTGEASSSRGTVSPGGAGWESGGRQPASIKRVGGKANVSSACGPCKKAHLACDVQRPCKRCTNMGKEALCEDVPHKKRGRPKVNKTPTGTPYSRARAQEDSSSHYRIPHYSNPPPGNYDSYYNPQSEYKPFYAPPPQARIPSPQIPGSDPPNLFTIFATTDARIMRVSDGSWALTGYHQPDFVGQSFLDWVHPSDRGLLEEERMRLLSLASPALIPNPNRDMIQNSIHHRTERELVSPADGMGDQYPNQNVRIVRADQQYNLFNVRLHLGGGLGGSLFQPESFDRLYLVISCLLIPAPPPHTRVAPSTSGSSYGPSTPITPMTAGPPGGLPGFSSIAAGIDAPLPSQSPRYPSDPYSSYFPRPSSQQQQQQQQQLPVIAAPVASYPRPTTTPQSVPGYASAPATTLYTKSPSPPPQFEVGFANSYAPYEYQTQPPSQSQQPYFPEHRGGSTDGRDQWTRNAGDDNPPPLQRPQPSSSSSSNPPPPTDYSRRPWES